jgi:hypothetical protein
MVVMATPNWCCWISTTAGHAAYGAINQVAAIRSSPRCRFRLSRSSARDRQRQCRSGLCHVRTGLLLNLVLTGGLVALIYLSSRTVLCIFITDIAVLDLARGLLYVALWSSVPFGMATVFSGAMRAGGVAMAPMMLSIFAIAAVEVPSAVILSRTIGVEGVWAAYPITFCAMFILQLGYYALVWRRRPLQRLI